MGERPRALLATLMWTCCGLFLVRILGQVIQYVRPQPWLPPFEQWQGSGIPYPLLLAWQLVIVVGMVLACARVSLGWTSPNGAIGRWTFRLAIAYMVLSFGRLAIGLLVASAPPWFSAWISGAFHVVLATFLLAYATHHLERKFLREAR